MEHLLPYPSGLHTQYICKTHTKKYAENKVLTPCRYTCKTCNTQKLDGYTNPSHVNNPFGYLYLVPNICNDCAISNKICIWCTPMKF